MKTHFAANATHIQADLNLSGGFGGNVALLDNITDTNVTIKLLRMASTGAGDGQQGVASVLNCSEGFSGPFCTPCAVGYFKSDNKSSPCSLCANKPENAVYTRIA